MIQGPSELNDKGYRTNWLAQELAQTISDDRVRAFDAQLEKVGI